MRYPYFVAILGSVIVGGVVGVTGAPLPLGHPPVTEATPRYGASDFYPSPERPLGWRGDGTGAWPGAKCVTNWNGETPSADSGQAGGNIVWKCPMPAPGNSQPLVIGEKVITMADPNLLICVNVHTGKILWQTEIDHTSVMPPEQQAKARIEKKFIADLRQRYGSYVRRVRDLQAKVKALGVEVDAICVPCKNFKQLGEPEDAKLKEGFVKAMADSGVKAEFEALVKEQGTDFRFPFRWGGASGYGDYFVNIVKGDPVGERVMAAAREYDLYTFDSWGEMHTSLTFATPATDGQFIYVTTLNNAVAAVDLDGKVRWLVWDHLAERSKHTSGMFAGTGTGTRFVASPFLAQGKFVVNQNGEMRVYDCATGKKLWGVYDVVVKSGLSKRTGSQFPWRPEPEAASPSWTVLKLPGGGDLPVIYDSCYFLFRTCRPKAKADRMFWLMTSSSGRAETTVAQDRAG